MIRSRDSDIRTIWPRLEARAEPIWTIGPSRPTEPPEPMQIAEASGLDDGDLRPDPPAVLGHGEHDLRNPVAAGLAGETLDQGAVDQAAGHRDHQQEPDPEPGQMEAGDTPLLAELLVSGGQPGRSARSASGITTAPRPGAHADHQGHHRQAEARAAQPRHPQPADQGTRTVPQPLPKARNARPTQGDPASHRVAMPARRASRTRLMLAQRKPPSSRARWSIRPSLRPSWTDARALAGRSTDLPAGDPLLDPAADDPALAVDLGVDPLPDLRLGQDGRPEVGSNLDPRGVRGTGEHHRVSWRRRSGPSRSRDSRGSWPPSRPGHRRRSASSRDRLSRRGVEGPLAEAASAQTSSTSCRANPEWRLVAMPPR